LSESKTASVAWQQAGGYIVPYVKSSEVDGYMGTETAYRTTYPSFCRPAALPRLTDDYAFPEATTPDAFTTSGDASVPAGTATAVATAYLTVTVSALVFVMSHLALITFLAVAAGVGVYCYCGCMRPKLAAEPST
jgi:hypothetical protein